MTRKIKPFTAVINYTLCLPLQPVSPANIKLGWKYFCPKTLQLIFVVSFRPGSMINIIITHADCLTEWGMLRASPHFLLAHNLFTGQRERERKREGERERVTSALAPFSYLKSKWGTLRAHPHFLLARACNSLSLFTGQRKRERERERERGRERVTGALAPFIYLVYIYKFALRTYINTMFKNIFWIGTQDSFFCSILVSFKFQKFWSCNTKVMTKYKKVNIAVTYKRTWPHRHPTQVGCVSLASHR